MTGWLACLHLLAGTLAMTGRSADGAVLLGAVQGLGGRAGYALDPKNPFDSPRNVKAVRSRLTPADYARAHAAGLRMNHRDLGTFIAGL
ncbi:hypothetical protein CS0771_54360 [Catellatospora sp. IY07-71]|nr:hypothetical protein CS0771_54360 [Catellatospora sp. IY07-71]